MKRTAGFSSSWRLITLKAIIIFYCVPLTAQIYPFQNAHWAFGDSLALKFNCHGALPVESSSKGWQDASSSSADKDGQLIFYVNSTRVWAQNHTQMPNGFGLYNSNIYQTSLIVPLPNSPNFYYIFQSDNHTLTSNPFAFVYSKMDLSLNGGLGDVVVGEKNVMIDSNQHSTSIAAAHHANGHDYWVFVHKRWPYLSLNAYLVNDNGLTNTPAESPTILPQAAIICARFSPSGDVFVATASLPSPSAQEVWLISKFDRATGLFYDQMLIPDSNNLTPLQFEFSPCGNTILFNTGGVESSYSMDLSIFDSAAIANSITVYDTNDASTGMQLGIDGAIYQTQGNLTAPFLMDRITIAKNGAIQEIEGFITYPNFIQFGLSNPISTNRYGLINPRAFCVNDTSHIDLLSCADSATWIFFDPETGDTAALYHGDSVEHVFTQPGEHPLHLWLTHGSITDTIIQHVCVSQPIEVNDLLPDTAICAGDTLEVNLSGTGGLIQWSDGQDSLIARFLDSDTISYTLSNACGVYRDTFVLEVDSFLQLDLGPDSIACIGDTVVLEPNLGSAQTVLWGDGTNGSSLQVLTSQTVTLHAQNACGADIDSIALYFTTVPMINLPNDTSFCDQPPQFIALESDTLVNYVWNDRVLQSSRPINDTGIYRLIAFNVCGADTHDISVSFQAEIEASLLPLYFLCTNDSLLLDVQTDSADYAWSTNDTSSFIYATEEGEYTVRITVNECVNIIQTEVVSEDCDTTQCKISTPNVITPNGDGVNDVFHIQSSCDHVKVELNIFNRWGQLILRDEMISSTKNQVLSFWDGYVNGTLVSEGTYFFTIRYQQLNSDEFSLQNGTVQVIR